jgi:hypothetical protein
MTSSRAPPSTAATRSFLPLTGLAFAGALEGSDPINDDTTAVVTDQTDGDQGEDADDQGEDENADDDQGDGGDSLD